MRKQLLLSISILLAWSVGMLASEASRDSIPNNYGKWVNLTDGYTEDKGDHQKMQVEIEENTIHLCWVEFAKG